MKALSLTQPWASLMASNEKRFETRGPTFPRRHLGELAIVSSKGYPSSCWRLEAEYPFQAALRKHRPPDALPLGVVLCVVEVVGYASADAMDLFAGGMISALRQPWLGVKPAEHERDFGDYSDRRTVIITRDVQVLATPVPVEHMEKGAPKAGGALGVYELSPACDAAVRAQLKATKATQGVAT